MNTSDAQMNNSWVGVEEWQAWPLFSWKAQNCFWGASYHHAGKQFYEVDLAQWVDGSQRYLASCAFYLIHRKILFAFLPVHQNISHIFVFAYAVNWSCIALLISASCSKSFKIYFPLSLLHILLNNYTFPHPLKKPSPTIWSHSVWVHHSSLWFFKPL